MASTPRKPVAPMCTVPEALPASIWPAMARALLIGIVKAWVWDERGRGLAGRGRGLLRRGLAGAAERVLALALTRRTGPWPEPPNPPDPPNGSWPCARSAERVLPGPAGRRPGGTRRRGVDADDLARRSST